MTQILTIHGGTTFANYDDYLEYLRSAPVHPERMTFKPMWRELLQQNLGPSYTVLSPSMPNKTNAKYSEWKLYFDKIVNILEEDCILIGHSLGAIFLVKYLSENKIPTNIAKTILVAAPHSDESTEDLTDFKLDATIPELFAQQAGEVTMLFGSDDPVIAPVEIERYRQALPSAEIRVMSAPDHFMREEFPEVLDAIKPLQAVLQ